MTALVTAAEWRSWAAALANLSDGKPASLTDDALTQLLDAATAYAREHCKRDWRGDDPDDLTRVLWPSNATGTVLQLGACAGVSTVAVVGSGALAAAEWAYVPTAGTSGLGLLLHHAGRWEPNRPVTVTGQFDAGTAPPPVVEAICRITYRWLISAPSIASEIAAWDQGVQVRRSWRDPDVVSLLEPFSVDAGR